MDYIARSRDVLARHTPKQLDFAAPREAAVLLLLCPHDDGAHVLFTVRTNTVEHHKGQISFPGGGRDAEDADFAATALREAWEEVGIHPDDVELIGRLDEAFTTSYFRVAPYVGVLRHTPYPFAPNPIEVAEVIEVPLAHLLDPATKVWETRDTEDGRIYTGPAFWYGEHRIWGATARMLDSFLELLRGIERPDARG